CGCSRRCESAGGRASSTRRRSVRFASRSDLIGEGGGDGFLPLAYLMEHLARLGPVQERIGFVDGAPADLVVLPVEHGFPAGGRVGHEAVHGHAVVDVGALEIRGHGDEPGLLGELPCRRLGRRLTVLDPARDAVPVAALDLGAAENEIAPAAPDEDEHLACSHAGKTTSARSPPSLRSSSVPPRSSRTSASTIESPVPVGSSPPSPAPSSEIASMTSPFRCERSTVTAPPPCSSAFWSSSLKTSASAVARSPASETGSSRASTVLPATSPWTSIARSRSSSASSSTSSSRRSVSTSW